MLPGTKVKPYLPELMQCMLQPLQTTSSPRAKELAVSALGAIGEERGRQEGHPQVYGESLPWDVCLTGL